MGDITFVDLDYRYGHIKADIKIVWEEVGWKCDRDIVIVALPMDGLEMRVVRLGI
jgi:hypothetical protein